MSTNDGNTALPVSPVQEEDMFKLSALLARAANAIVRETELAKTVEALTKQVQDLTADVAQKVMHAQELDYTIHELRTARDGLQDKVHDLEFRCSSQSDQIMQMHDADQMAKAVINDLTTKLSDAKKDRDDHGLRAMQLEDELKALHETHTKLRDLLGSVASPPVVTGIPQALATKDPEGGASYPFDPSPSSAPQTEHHQEAPSLPPLWS